MRYLAILVCLAILSAGCMDGSLPSRTGESPVEVTSVVDGDTVDVRLPDGTTDTVRFLGVDTPEVYDENQHGEFGGLPNGTDTKNCLRKYAEEATDFLEKQLSDGNVTIRPDSEADRRGKYDRLLAYVYTEGSNRSLNYRLLERGYARVYRGDFSKNDSYVRKEVEARGKKLGLWSCIPGDG
ncbi:MAG: thermonuclease family protein [Halobacteria archaeon]